MRLPYLAKLVLCLGLAPLSSMACGGDETANVSASTADGVGSEGATDSDSETAGDSESDHFSFGKPKARQHFLTTNPGDVHTADGEVPAGGETPGQIRQDLFLGSDEIRTVADPQLQKHRKSVLAAELAGGELHQLLARMVLIVLAGGIGPGQSGSAGGTDSEG